MPIAQRPIEPVLVAQSRSVISGGAVHPPETLAATSIITLTALIRQLGALSKYADELFGEVFNEASKYVYRGNKLQERVASLSHVLQTKLKNKDVVIQGNIELTPAEKPEQHILNAHMPRALLEQYHKCDKSPPLEIFARVRNDGQCSLQLYTDPSLFFKEWVIRMNREANVLRNPNKKRSRRSRTSIRNTQHSTSRRSPALPPVPQPSAVYENRDIEDNIYEMLPDSPIQSPSIRRCSSPYKSDPQPSYPEIMHHDELSIRSSLNSLSLDSQQYYRNPPPPFPPSQNNMGDQKPYPRNTQQTYDRQTYYHGNTFDLTPNYPNFHHDQTQQHSAYNDGNMPQFEDLPPPPEELLDYSEGDQFQELPTPPLLDNRVTIDEDGLYDTLPPRALPSLSPSQFSPITISPHSTLHSVPQTPLSSATPCVSEGKQSSLSYSSAMSGPTDFLAAIRAGIKLKPTLSISSDKEPTHTVAVHDVASILQRRKFLIGDISDGSSSSDSGSEWGENDSWN